MILSFHRNLEKLKKKLKPFQIHIFHSFKFDSRFELVFGVNSFISLPNTLSLAGPTKEMLVFIFMTLSLDCPESRIFRSFKSPLSYFNLYVKKLLPLFPSHMARFEKTTQTTADFSIL